MIGVLEDITARKSAEEALKESEAVLRVADGLPLSIRETPEPRGHAFEFRINAEDVGRGFLPTPGPVRTDADFAIDVTHGPELLPLADTVVVPASPLTAETRHNLFLAFKEALQGLFEISMRLIGIVIKMAPYAVAALMFSLSARFGWDLLKTLGWFAFTVIDGPASCT